MISPVKQYIPGMRYGAPVWYPPFRHPGFDLLPINQNQDQQIIAPYSGVVAYVGYSIGAGNICDINLDNGKAVRMCHMKYRASVKVGQSVAQGDLIGIIGATGLLVRPKGYKHLHYVLFTNHNRNVTMDPAPYLINNPTPAPEALAAQVPALFALIWHRLPAPGEIKYFVNRLKDKSIVDRNDLITKLTYWYQTVYPKGILNIDGDDKWQRAKK